jgi:hypothetical protein
VEITGDNINRHRRGLLGRPNGCKCEAIFVRLDLVGALPQLVDELPDGELEGADR